MSCHAIDYFATLSRSAGPLQCKNLPSATSNSSVHPSEIWNDAITDMAVIYFDDEDEIPGDDPDDDGNIPYLNYLHEERTWELIKYTVEGLPANCNSGDSSKAIVYIGIQRRKRSRRLDHISEITVLEKGDSIPEGFYSLANPLTWETHGDGSTTAHRRIVIKRAPDDDFVFSHGHAFVDDVCVVNLSEEETAPEEYRTIDQLMGGSNRGSSVGDRVMLSYHHRPALGICNIPFEAATLDRYPRQDHDRLELPVMELPVFVFPHDLKLEYTQRFNFPIPNFFTFVFTDVQGRHLYAACLRFYEELPKEIIDPIASAMFGKDHYTVSWSDDMQFFCPKVICMVSQFPFYRAMGRYLKQLYSLSLSPSQCPLEQFISSVVAQVPLPVEGGRPFHVVLDAALISQTSRAMPPVVFDLPSKFFFPPMDLDFAGPMRCLSVENMLALFYFLLQESKVIFLCSSHALLTEVMETFRSLLFPLSWTSCFITRLPDSLNGVLQAPGGFMIGLHIADDSERHECENAETHSNHKKPHHQLGSKNYSEDHIWMRSLQSGTYIADLTSNKLFVFSGGRADELSSSKINQLLKQLPSGPYRKLHAKIQSIGAKFRICPQQFEGVGLVQFDSAFDCVSIDEMSLPSGRKWVDFPTYAVRDAFLAFMCDVLSDFSKYIKQPEEVTTSNNFGKSFNELFMIEEYIRDADKSLKGVLRHLMDTQMFPYLIQQRMEECYFPLVFFDQAVKALKELGITSIPNDRRSVYQNVTSKQNVEIDSETPLYEHVLRLSDKEATFSLPKKPTLIAVDGDFLKQRPDLLLPTHFGSTDSSDGDKMQHFLSSRKELGNQQDHQLDDKTKGCLIIPGPLRQEGECDDPLDDDERQSLVMFRYESGWPTLDSKLLDSVESDLHTKGLYALKEARKRMVVQTDSRSSLFIRPPNYRLSYHTSQSLLRQVPLKMTAESKGSIGTVLDIFALSIMMLSIRAVNGIYPIGSILQLFSIVSHLDKSKILNFLDETSWRSMLVACCSIDAHDFGHKATCILFETMKSADKPTDALAFTQYCQSFSRKLRKTSSTPMALLDPFCHLEQLGLSWFSQKSIPLETPIPSESATCNVEVSDHPHTPVKKSLSGPHTPPPPPEGSSPHGQSPSTPSSGGNIWRLFKGSMKNASVEVAAPVTDEFAEKALIATSDMAKSLKMGIPREPYSLLKPIELPISMVSKTLPSTIIPPELELSEKKLEERTKELRVRYAKTHASIVPLVADASLDDLDDHATTKGKLIVGAIAICGLPTKNAHNQPIRTKNVYSRVWLSSDSAIRLKTQPCIRVVDNMKSAESKDVRSVEHLNFYISEVENTHVHFEVFGDFLRDNEEICYAFDQSLGVGSVIIHADSKPVWINLSGVDANIHPQLYVSIRYEKASCPEEQYGSVNSSGTGLTPEKSHAAALDAHRTSTGAGKSWRDRFSTVFSKSKGRSSSNGTSRSMTPPPQDAAHSVTAVSSEVPPPYAAHAPATIPADEDVTITDEKLSKTVEKIATVDDKSTTIATFQMANTESSNPIDVFENAPEKKSRRWRNSLAMLTGEDVTEIDSAEEFAGSPGIGQRIRRRLSGMSNSGKNAESGDDLGNDSADRSEIDTHFPASSSPPKPSGMKAAFRRLSGDMSGSFMRGGKKESGEVDPLVGNPISTDAVSRDGEFTTGNNEDVAVGSDISPGIDAALENPSTDVNETSASAIVAGTVHEGQADSHSRITSMNLVTDRTSVDIHPLCASDLDENAHADYREDEDISEGPQEMDYVEAITIETANIQLHIDTTEVHAQKDAGKEEEQEDQIVDDEFIDHIRTVGLEFTKEVINTRSVVGIFCETPCSNCGYLMFDDEMVATWGGFCDKSLNKDGNIVNAHVILCPICKNAIVPTLHVRKYECAEGAESISTTWQCNVQYLSAYGLRYVMEHLLAEYGFQITNVSWLIENSPMAYWNLMWHCTRLNTPSGLFINIDAEILSSHTNSPWLGPVLINWREHTLKARARKLIEGRGVDVPLELSDIFPDISEEDCEIVRSVMREVDDSIPGVAKALTGLSNVPSLQNQLGGTQGRKIYMVVLMVIHLFKPVDLILSSQDLPGELSKGIVFDRRLMEVVSIAFKPADFEKMATNDTELIVASSSRAAQALRVAFGLLM